MLKNDDCIRCGSSNVDIVTVNTPIKLNYPEVQYYGVITQKVVSPTNALICKDCGHIELFIDWNKIRK